MMRILGNRRRSMLSFLEIEDASVSPGSVHCSWSLMPNSKFLKSNEKNPLFRFSVLRPILCIGIKSLMVLASGRCVNSSIFERRVKTKLLLFFTIVSVVRSVILNTHDV